VVTGDEARAMLQAANADMEPLLFRVGSLDFTMLKRKLVEEEGWTAEKADEVEALYRQFLVLNALYPDQKVCPNGPIDEFWHAHIVDTRAYHADCNAVFGQYLHHYPYFGMRGHEDELALQRTFRESCELFVLHFGVDLTSGGSFGRSCSSQRCP
jgi:hypothetical protein